MPDTSTRLAVTIAEAAEMCGVSPQTINIAIRAGALRAKRIGGGTEKVHARISTKDLLSWFDSLPDA